MEGLLGISNEILKIFEKFDSSAISRAQDYESKMKVAMAVLDLPSTIAIKKQKRSLNDEEPDSGIDATTTTTSSTATSSSASGSVRPSRTAKTKASGNLKLPRLGTKLRQEVKLERISEVPTISTVSSGAKENDLNSLNIKREKLSVGALSQATDTDSSILVIPNEVNIITLSDDEEGDDNKMPPPMKPAPKKLAVKKTRTKKANASESDSSQSTQSILSEASSLQTTEEGSILGATLKPKKTKKTKSRKPVLPIIEKIKEEQPDSEPLQPSSQEPSSSKNVRDTNDNLSSKNVTLESVYEDASDKISSQASIALPVSATYICGPSKATNNSVKNIQQNDDTSEVPKANDVGKSKTSYSSLITEDDSEDESLPMPVVKNSKNQKELFNPCIQSPMKAKVAAFERQAQASQSPGIPVRQTRTKTRQLAKENVDNGTSKLPKPSTPSVEIRSIGKEQTPLGLSTKMYQSLSVLRAQPPSASKILGTSKPVSSQKVRSRDNSVEDMTRSREAILEKKRKGEERSKRAQMQREAQEKEKLEKLLKARQEKEAAREALKEQRQQQELLKQQKALEQKRERERRLKAELAEAAKQERDNLLAKKIAEGKAYLESMKERKKDEAKSVFTFDMLQTDDSTDDEDAPSRNRPHRPSPPAWSLRVNRKSQIIAQAGVDPRVIDKFFSCQPTTPDLAAIFPKIDQKHLKRNSSAVWSTPPRYSLLPKY